MDKQYSVEFFSCFVDTVQKLCRDYLNFEQAVELSGYLCLEIDNSKKERYVLSELVQSSGDVISESYCTKAFKTVRKGPTSTVGYRDTENIGPPSRQYRERSSREPSTNMLYQRGNSSSVDQMSSRHAHFVVNARDLKSPPGQFPVGGRETHAGRSDKSQDMRSPNTMSAGNTYSRTETISEPRALKRTATSPEDTPSSKKDKVRTGLSSASNESLEKERIHMPVAVTIKQENDVPFMVIDNPDDDIPEDHSSDNRERGLVGGNGIGDSQRTTERSAHARQIQEKERNMGHNMEHNRNETFSNIQRMLKAQQENMMRIHTAPSVPFMRTMSPVSQTYSCEKCGYVSKWKSNLTRHMRLKHGEVNNEHTVGYPYNQVLYPHNMYSTSVMSNYGVGQTHTQQQQVNEMVSSAGNVANDKQNQNHQMESMKNDPEEEMTPKYRCQVPDCGQSFSASQQLQVHMDSHYKIKPYKCDNCSETFESQQDWEKHSSACETNISEARETNISAACETNISAARETNISACTTKFESETEAENYQTEMNHGDAQNDSSDINDVQNNMISFEAEQTENETETHQEVTLNVSSS